MTRLSRRSRLREGAAQNALPAIAWVVTAGQVTPLLCGYRDVIGDIRMEKQKLDKNGIRRTINLYIFLSILHIVLLVISGDYLWWNAWAFTGGYMLWVGIIFIVMATINPNLLNERGKKHKNTKPFDRRVMFLFSVFFVSMPIVAGIDHRLGISNISEVTSIVGILLTIPVFSLVLWTFIVNNHFEAMVRIQEEREHQVCTDGPYKLVRHPTYLAAIVGFILIPFILGTAYALIPCLLMAIVFVVRTKLEDKTLIAELEGYKEFTQETKYRLLPGIW
jgi:protein-S-isoprenylcysteine O-methyltransferase Ste14